MTTQEKIEVMQAYDRDKDIQMTHFNNGEWKDIKDPVWDWARFAYRVKPKERKFKDDDLVVWKIDEADPINRRDVCHSKDLALDGANENDYAKFDDALWYWEYQDENGYWIMTDYRATKAEIQKLSNFHNFAPLYGLGFRLKDSDE